MSLPQDSIQQKAAELKIPVNLAYELVEYDAVNTTHPEELAAATKGRMDLLRKMYGVKEGELTEYIGKEE